MPKPKGFRVRKPTLMYICGRILRWRLNKLMMAELAWDAEMEELARF